jgi:hypothetical protein
VAITTKQMDGVLYMYVRMEPTPGLHRLVRRSLNSSKHFALRDDHFACIRM